jgi:hypothetical protein
MHPNVWSLMAADLHREVQDAARHQAARRLHRSALWAENATRDRVPVAQARQVSVELVARLRILNRRLALPRGR